MSKTTITPEMAQKEVSKWLDGKKIRERKREKLSENIKLMQELFEDGVFILNEDLTITQKLYFETAGKKELTHKLRITVKDMMGYNHDNPLIKAISCITGETTGVVANLDTEDLDAASVIQSFF